MRILNAVGLLFSFAGTVASLTRVLKGGGVEDWMYLALNSVCMLWLAHQVIGTQSQ